MYDYHLSYIIDPFIVIYPDEETKHRLELLSTGYQSSVASGLISIYFLVSKLLSQFIWSAAVSDDVNNTIGR